MRTAARVTVSMCGARALTPADMRVTVLLLVSVVLVRPDDEHDTYYIDVVDPSPLTWQSAGPLASLAAAAVGVEEGEGEGVREVRVRVGDVEPDEALQVPRGVCAAAARGSRAALIGAGEDATVLRDAAAAAARVGLPLVALGPVPTELQRDVLALYPPEEDVLYAARDLAIEKGWQRAVLLYAGSARGAALLAPDDSHIKLLARQLPLRDDALLRDLLLVLKKSGHMNYVVWSDAASALRVLNATQRVGMLSERYSYIITSLELHTLQLDEYSYGGANVTGLMAFDPTADEVRQLDAAWRACDEECQAAWKLDGKLPSAPAPVPAPTDTDADPEQTPQDDGLTRMPTAVPLAAMGAEMVAEALNYLQLPQMDMEASCESGQGDFHAETILNYIRSTEHAGGTAWAAGGERRGTVLLATELARGGHLRPVAEWRRHAPVVWRRPPEPAPLTSDTTMTNRTFNILIALNKPYVMRKKSIHRLSGNDRYEGFCIELIEQLAEHLKFNYTFIEGPSDYDEMLRTLTGNKDMHFAITDLTITAKREKEVDFTTPFMNLGISILFHTPTAPEPNLFAFLLPFSSGVWLCLGVAYVGTSLVLYVLGRLCPEEWQNPYPCIEEPPALENQFTIGNALWFNLGAVLLQGSEIAPVAYGSRAAAGSWWLFALVITSSYTANLATLLAKKTSNDLIKNVEELAHNDLGIDYGAKATGATYTFFKDARSPLYHEMFEHLEANRNNLPKNNDEGIERVKNGNYAFLMESVSIEYVVERVCEVTQVGDLLDSKGYGIAMAKDSPYRQDMNLGLLRLQEAGKLREMKHRWWKERNGGGACKDVEDRSSSKLEMNSFRGLFLVLIVGCALGVVLSCCDLAAVARRHPRDPTRSFRHNFAHELRFVFSFDLSAKPVEGPLIPSEPESVASEMEPEGQREVEGEVEVEGEREGEREVGRSASPSGVSVRPRRRRSSIHTASMRLARHATMDHDH